MPSVKNCRFCTIGDRVLLKNDLAVAFLSDPRKVKGHFLVTPRRHVEKPWELSTEEHNAVFELVSGLQKGIMLKLGEGSDIRQNYRPFIKEDRLKVDHVHFHVIPRSSFDNIYDVSERYDTVLFQKLTPKEAKEVKNLL